MAIIELGVARLAGLSNAGGDDKARAAWRAELARLVAGGVDADWDPSGRDKLLAVLKGEGAASPPSRKVAEAHERALALYRDGKYDEAWAIAGALAEANGDIKELQILTCDIAYRRKGEPRRLAIMEPLCRRAARVADDAYPELLLADAYLDARREAEARTVLSRAHQRLEYGEAKAERWSQLAGLYQRAKLPTLAEGAAVRAGEPRAAEVRAWTRTLRRRFALPENAFALGLPPPREAEYLSSIEVGMAACDEDRRGAAAQIAAGLGRDYPKLPGGYLLRCQIALRENKVAAAQAACAAALAIQEDAVPLHLLAGFVEMSRGKVRPALAHIERARALDPDNRAPWRTLAEVYRKSGDRGALDKLRAEYSDKFHEPLQ